MLNTLFPVGHPHRFAAKHYRLLLCGKTTSRGNHCPTDVYAACRPSHRHRRRRLRPIRRYPPARLLRRRFRRRVRLCRRPPVRLVCPRPRLCRQLGYPRTRQHRYRQIRQHQLRMRLASRLKYVLAGTERQLNCFEVAVYGTVLDANNRPLAGVTIEAVGIHGTQGRHVGIVGEDGTYTIPLARFSELPHSEWYVAIFEGNEEVSERFHWTATAACQSSDSGDSQVLWVHWKLVE